MWITGRQHVLLSACCVPVFSAVTKQKEMLSIVGYDFIVAYAPFNVFSKSDISYQTNKHRYFFKNNLKIGCTIGGHAPEVRLSVGGE